MKWSIGCPFIHKYKTSNAPVPICDASCENWTSDTGGQCNSRSAGASAQSYLRASLFTDKSMGPYFTDIQADLTKAFFNFIHFSAVKVHFSKSETKLVEFKHIQQF